MISTLGITAAIRKTHICTRWTFNSTFDCVRLDRVALLSCLILDHRLRPANAPRQPLAPRSAATRPERSPGCLRIFFFRCSSSACRTRSAHRASVTASGSSALHLGPPHPVVWMVGPGTQHQPDVRNLRNNFKQPETFSFQLQWDTLQNKDTVYRCKNIARVSPWHLFVKWRPLKAHCATLRNIVMRI